MTIITKQLLNHRPKRRKAPRGPQKRSTLVFDSLVLANSDLIFSLGTKITLKVPVIAGNPLLSIGKGTNVAINIAAIYDSSLIAQFEASLGDLDELTRLIDQNRDKLSMKTISCDQKSASMLRTDTYSYSHETSLKPRSFMADSSPFDLAIVAFATRSRSKKRAPVLCSVPILQKIIVGNTLQPAQNIVDTRPQRYDKYLEFDLINNVDASTEAYFSDQFYSQDPDNFLKFVFFWDKIQFLKEKSSFGNILNNTSIESARQKMIDDSLITDIRIFRHRIKPSFTGFSLFDKNQKPVVIISSSESESDGFLPSQEINQHNKKITAEISSLGNVQNTGEYITFLVNDYYPQICRTGLYRYTVKVRLQDGMLKFLLEALELLRQINKEFLTYANIFSQEPSAAKNTSLQNVENMLDVLFALSTFTDASMQSIRAEFSLLLNSRTGLSQLISFNDNLMLKIADALGTRGITNSSAKGKTISKNTSKLYFLEDEQEFGEVINLSDFNDIKYEYLGMTDILGMGASAFALDDIKNRFFDEFTKVINYDGRQEEINFADLNTKLYGDNLKTNKNKQLKNNMFSLEKTYYSYLSPVVINPGKISQLTTEAQWTPGEYNNPVHSRPQEISLSYGFQQKGITIESRATTTPTSPELYSKASDMFGKSNKLNSPNVSQQTVAPKEANAESFQQSMVKSSSILDGVNKFYNNIELTKESFNLNNSSNLLKTASKKSSKAQSQERLEDMPNQIRALFGSRSDVVVNKWALSENDFFSNPETTNMMKENYSNLIKIEVLSDFGKDASGEKIVKLPIFKKLESADLDGILSGRVLFCRTYRLDQKSLGIGMKRKDDTTEDAYYNKYFIITESDFS